jgi:hypothetical protein
MKDSLRTILTSVGVGIFCSRKIYWYIIDVWYSNEMC